MKKMTLIITGSIAAQKTFLLVKNLQQLYNVTVIVTKSALKFINLEQLQTVTTVVGDDLIDAQNHMSLHIELAKNTDLLIVYPATQNFIAKISHGFSDDLASLVFSSAQCYKMIFPAMNSQMYLNPANLKNIQLLRSFDIEVLTPLSGKLACNTNGIGRAWEPQMVKQYIQQYFKIQNLLKDKKVLIAFGRTRTYLDHIRYITNCSSGKMGLALVKVLKWSGANLTVVTGDVDIELNFETFKVETNQAMLKVINKFYESQDIVINLAALNDFAIKKPYQGKINKKNPQICNFDLIPNVDVLKFLGQKKQHQILIGFSAQENNHAKTAALKLVTKNLDAIIMNNINTMGQDKTKITWLTKDKSQTFLKSSKIIAAQNIVLEISKMLPKK